MKSVTSFGCDLFSNRNINRFDPAKPIRFYKPADDSAGQGGGSGNNADPNAGGGNNNSNNDNPVDRDAKIAAAVKQTLTDLLGKNGGDKDATLEYLTKRVHGLEIQREEAKKSALSKEDKAAYDAFKALNLSVDDIKKIVGEYSTWSEERARDSKIGTLKKAAEVAKANGDLLASLEGAMGVEYIITGEGDKAVATVEYKDSTGAEQVKPLADWAKEKWPALETALFTIGGASAPKVTRFGKTPPAGSGQKPSVFDEIRERNQAAAEKVTKGKSFTDKAREAGMIS